MKNMNKVKISNLNYVLQIGHNSKPDPYEPDFYGGFFDNQKNYHPAYECPWYDDLTPWEWVVIPEIVEQARKSGIEVPEDPPFDISKTF